MDLTKGSVLTLGYNLIVKLIIDNKTHFGVYCVLSLSNNWWISTKPYREPISLQPLLCSCMLTLKRSEMSLPYEPLEKIDPWVYQVDRKLPDREI